MKRIANLLHSPIFVSAMLVLMVIADMLGLAPGAGGDHWPLLLGVVFGTGIMPAAGAIATPAVQERLAQLGATVAAPNERSSQWLADFVKSEVKKWEAPIKASGVQVE